MQERKKNKHISSKLIYTGHNTTPTNIHFIQYNESGHHEKRTNNAQDILSLINDQSVSWILVSGMNNPELITNLVKNFGLSTLDAKDILTVHHIITVEEYDENIFMVLPATYYIKNKEVTEHIALVLGKNYVISFQESDNPLFKSVYTAINESSLRINNKKADFLFVSLLNIIMNNYSESVSQLEEDLEDLEDQLLDIEHLKKNLIGDIQEKRREMIRLRKMLIPFKEQLVKLLHANNALISKDIIPYYKDVYDQTLYILQNIESCREILSSLVDLYLNNNDLKMNLIMKRLTVVATIFIPLTFLVGVWGMNFKFMPELSWRYGYLFSWIIMFIIGFYVVWYLKKKDWF